MPSQGYGWLPMLGALAVAGLLMVSWHNLWRQQQRLDAIYHWRVNLLQVQQAQRQHFTDHGRFAESEQQLVSAGLLPASLDWPYATQWQYHPQASANSLLMQTELVQAPVTLLLKDFNSYLWQPPQLTVKVVGYASQ